MGGSDCPPDLYEETFRIARDLAAAGFAILCGGGSGVMEAAAHGAREAGGVTIGIMPGSNARESRPNAWIQIPIYTGLGDARNAVNVRSADIVVAVGGAYGTLSEIALALKIGKPVIGYRTWDLSDPPQGPPGAFRRAATPEEAVLTVRRLSGNP
ncbi:MAG: TIGR00725 family protein [Candidatus Eisenbacteria bacterium]|nr:TIGR00725 family protein [Candidatus Eisenbacteria bacterium]